MARLDTTSSRTQGAITLHRVINPDGSLGGWVDTRIRFNDQDTTYISPAVTLIGPMTLTNCHLGSAERSEPLTITVTEDNSTFGSTLENLTWDGWNPVNITASRMNLDNTSLFGAVHLLTPSVLHLKDVRLQDSSVTAEAKVAISDSALHQLILTSVGVITIDDSYLSQGHYHSSDRVGIYSSHLTGIDLQVGQASKPFTQLRCYRDPMWAEQAVTLTEHDVLIGHKNPLFNLELTSIYNRQSDTVRFVSITDTWSLVELTDAVTRKNLTVDNCVITEAQYAYLETILAQAALLGQLAQ